ncbi:MAG: aldo/keto reductase [Clostridia bacterium]|nr:aldo/keto reductase [Clostridia bacterium]
MQYRNDQSGNPLSVLGFGCMRFTKKGNGLDLEKAEKEILAAYHSGVNYYDTAYIYPGSEELLGTVLERNHIREKVNVATKLPHFMVGNRAGIDRIFDEERKRLRTEYVDYYLMHHMTDSLQWERLKSVGILEWIEEKKAAGQIRNIGFSYHGNSENFLRILEDYDWNFCQIQYNYLDETSQAGAKGLKAAEARHIPVMIMEPLRGGKLVNMLPEEAKQAFRESGRNWTPAEWAFRWLYNQSGVTVVLSGMNSLEMVAENVYTADLARQGELQPEDFKTIEKVVKAIRAGEKVGCTGCRYCMPCPQGVDIPGIFRSYNLMYTEGKQEGRLEFAQTVGLTEKPAFATRCIGCGKCEAHCPQSIPIREKLKEADRALRPLPYKIGIALARKFMLRRGRKKAEG